MTEERKKEETRQIQDPTDVRQGNKGMPPHYWLDDPETEYPWYDNGVIL